jgi:hypothetical protein
MLDAAGLHTVPLTVALLAGVVMVSGWWLRSALQREQAFNAAQLRRVRQGYVRPRTPAVDTPRSPTPRGNWKRAA